MNQASSDKPINKVPTNIITGFLGVGKTSAILNLLKTKPENERWAVLVNEFGEIGVDGSLFQGMHTEESGVFIREVPGGCMCCAAGLPMQIALNQLLAKARPDRLLIEPTGLGHPVEVLEVLSESYYQDALSVQKVITLVDARKVSDSRYTGHDTFNQQIKIADIVVGNKQDLYQENEQQALVDYVKNNFSAEVLFTEQGVLSPEILEGETEALVNLKKAHHHHHHDSNTSNLNDQLIPQEEGFIKAENSGEGFKSVGWRFDANQIFNYSKLYTFLCGLNAERMKAVFITNQGIYGYNLTSDALTEVEMDESLESRIEIIASDINEQWDKYLFDCLESE